MAKPKKINYKAILIGLLVCAAAALILLAGLWTKHFGRMAELEEDPGADSSAYGAAQSEADSARFDLSVWVDSSDWQEGLEEVNAVAGMPDSIQAYSAAFNEEDGIFFTEDASQMILALGIREGANDLPVYLTLVNNRARENGEWIYRDGALLKRLLTTEKARARHIDDLVILARTNGFNGVEINYANISGTAREGFILFLDELYDRLTGLDMKLRVVLEQGGGWDAAALPEGPEYVVAAYDLNGTGAIPGPRTDAASISDTAKQMDGLPGNARMAFATGGIDWDASGNAREITETEAYELSLFSGNIQRDKNSGALYFEYTAEDGTVHTVWYADAETLAGWFDLSKSLGCGRAALWKMGGARPDTLKMLGNLKGASLN
jgi:hypothetical protein